MTTASKNVYKKYKEKRLSDRAKIHDLFKWDWTAERIGYTYPELARRLEISIGNAQKRAHDLWHDGQLRIVGQRSGYSVYKEANERKRMTLSQAYFVALNQYCEPEQVKKINELVKHLT